MLQGELRVPGDKSISHRALLVGALARGRSRVTGLNTGLDVRATGAALTQLGARCALEEENHQVEVEGYGWDSLTEPSRVLECGNSGTSMRLLTGVCALVDGLSVLTGDQSLSRRPMLRVVAPLRQMGARIDGRLHGDRPPLAIRGGHLTGVDVELDVPSAQVKSALLLAGVGAEGATSVREPLASRDHTERMLEACGARLEMSDGLVRVLGGTPLRPLDVAVPGDLSAAAFFVVAAALVPGSELTLLGVGLNSTRTGVLDVLAAMGADLRVEPRAEQSFEAIGDITISHSPLKGVTVDPADVPRLIDELPVLAIAASQAEGETVITGAGELRVKESDRIEKVAHGLRKLGVSVETLPDGLIVKGPALLQGGEIDSAGDHRIAMAFAVAGLVAEAKVTIKGWSSVETSFPGFLELLDEATHTR